MSDTNTPPINERAFILIMGLVQFINILIFVMVMPMGPDFATHLDIPLHRLGYISGSHMFAAALSGLVGAFVLDWFDRRAVILAMLFCLSLATMLATLAVDLKTLMAARFLAGSFSGPLTAAALAMIADVIPAQRRGVAMGKITGAFSVASVLGIPFGLEMARHFGWRAPFLVIGVLGLVAVVVAYHALPLQVNEKAERNFSQQYTRLWLVIRNRLAWSAWGFTALAVTAGFMIIPNLAGYVQYNLHFPREKLGLLYLLGGGISFFSMRFAGRLVDRFSATLVSILSAILICLVACFGMVWPVLSAYLLFTGFMVANTARNVAGQTLSSQVPLPRERAGFMSLQNTITNACCAIGAFTGSMILVQDQSGMLLHMPRIGWMVIILSLAVPFLFRYTERALECRKRQIQPDPIVAVAVDAPDSPVTPKQAIET